MPDIERQVEAYVEFLDAQAPAMEEIGARAERLGEQRRPWAMPLVPRRAATAAVAAALVVLTAVGAAVLFRDRAGDIARPTTTVETTTTTVLPATSPLRFELHPAGTVFRGGEEGGGAFGFTSPGGVVVVGDEVHMFRNDYGDAGGVVRHGISTNGGITFSEDPAEVFDLEGDECCEPVHLVRSAAVAPDGSWTLFLETKDLSRSEGGPVVYRAVAPRPTDRFQLDPRPILDPGIPGGWDEGGVGSPTVVAVPDGLVMFYVGKDGAGVERIGRALSSDGAVWTKDAAPVFEAELDWEGGGLSRVDVTRIGDTWVMLYAGSSAGMRGLAVSGDGVIWTRLARVPVLTTTDVPRPQIRDAELVTTPGGPLLYLENGGARTASDVILLEGVGDLGR